jgi:hypothetical protein
MAVTEAASRKCLTNFKHMSAAFSLIERLLRGSDFLAWSEGGGASTVSSGSFVSDRRGSAAGLLTPPYTQPIPDSEVLIRWRQRSSSTGIRAPASGDPHPRTLPPTGTEKPGKVIHPQPSPGSGSLAARMRNLYRGSRGSATPLRPTLDAESRARSANSAHRSVGKPLLQHRSSRIAMQANLFTNVKISGARACGLRHPDERAITL